MSITTITSITVDAGKVDAFLELLKAGAATTRAATGCLSFDFYVNAERAGEVIFIEEWQSEDAQGAYVAGRIEDGSMAELGAYFTAPPQTKVLREVP